MWGSLLALGGLWGAVVPLVHTGVLWGGPGDLDSLKPWMPLPLELAVAWLPWLGAVASKMRSARRRPPVRSSSASRDRFLLSLLIAAATLLLSIHYLVRFRWHAAEQGPALLATELGSVLSTTWFGAPVVVLAYWLGLAATAVVVRDTVEASLRQLRAGGRTAVVAGASAAIVQFVIGSSALLRYATGSPWPLLG